jgi:hypothetical protein
MTSAGAALGNGLYTNRIDSINLEENQTLTVGLKTLQANVPNSWTLFDNFRLYYHGQDIIPPPVSYKPEEQLPGGDIVGKKYFNLLGIEVAQPLPNTIYMEKTIFSDRQSRMRKVMFR